MKPILAMQIAGLLWLSPHGMAQRLPSKVPDGYVPAPFDAQAIEGLPG